MHSFLITHNRDQTYMAAFKVMFIVTCKALTLENGQTKDQIQFSHCHSISLSYLEWSDNIWYCWIWAEKTKRETLKARIQMCFDSWRHSMKLKAKSASSSTNAQTAIIKITIPIQHKRTQIQTPLKTAFTACCMIIPPPQKNNKNYMAEQMADTTGRHLKLTPWLQLSDM